MLKLLVIVKKVSTFLEQSRITIVRRVMDHYLQHAQVKEIAITVWYFKNEYM